MEANVRNKKDVLAVKERCRATVNKIIIMIRVEAL